MPVSTNWKSIPPALISNPCCHHANTFSFTSFHSVPIIRGSCSFPFPIFKGYSLLPYFFRSFCSSTTSFASLSVIFKWSTNSRPLSLISSSPRNCFSMFHVTAVNTLLTSLEVAVDNWCLVLGVWCVVFCVSLSAAADKACCRPAASTKCYNT